MKLRNQQEMELREFCFSKIQFATVYYIQLLYDIQGTRNRRFSPKFGMGKLYESQLLRLVIFKLGRLARRTLTPPSQRKFREASLHGINFAVVKFLYNPLQFFSMPRESARVTASGWIVGRNPSNLNNPAKGLSIDSVLPQAFLGNEDFRVGVNDRFINFLCFSSTFISIDGRDFLVESCLSPKGFFTRGKLCNRVTYELIGTLPHPSALS